MRDVRFPAPPVAFLAFSALGSMSCSSESTTPSTAALDYSFKNDVMPIVRTSCALSACHSSDQKNLGIYLSNDRDQVYAELQKESPTAKQPFVVAKNPAKSYLIVKLDGKQSVGTAMPPPPDQLLSAQDRDVIRDWITNGAKNN